YQRVVIHTPKVIFVSLYIVWSAIRPTCFIEDGIGIVVADVLPPTYPAVIISQYRTDHHLVAENLIFGHDGVGLAFEEVRTAAEAGKSTGQHQRFKYRFI